MFSDLNLKARAKIVKKRLATWSEVEGKVGGCRNLYHQKPGISEKAFVFAQQENTAAADELRSRRFDVESIKSVLFKGDISISVRSISAIELPKKLEHRSTKGFWKMSEPIAPMSLAVLSITGRLTNVANRTEDPTWEPWDPRETIRIQGLVTDPQIKIYESISHFQNQDEKYLIGIAKFSN